MTLDEIRERRELILAIASRHGARNVRLFGSTARGTSGHDSDVDLLVELEPGRTLFDLGGLLVDLQSAIGVRVDMAIDRMLRPEVRPLVLREAIPL